MRRPRQTLAAALLLPLLAACGGAPQASDPPPAPEETTTPAEAVTPDAPSRPAQVEREGRTGAEAAVTWFLESMDHAGETGDTSTFRDSFAGTCTRCSAIADAIDRTYDRGGRIEGGAWIPFKFEYYGVNNGVAVIDAYVNYEPQIIVDEAGADARRFERQSNVLKAFQLTRDEGWIVGALDPDA